MRNPPRKRQRGASLLIPVLVLLTAGAFAVIVAATQSGGDIQGTDAQADSTEALFLAETGLERALRRFQSGAPCTAAGLGETLNNLASIGIAAGRSITISAGADSDLDFNLAALPATRCRIQVTARITASNVARTVQAILDRNDNFIGEVAVAGFDNPAGAVNPAASWTGAAGRYDYTGGYLAGANQPNCRRSAYVVKARQAGGSANATSEGSAAVAFTVARPSTILATFDYRIVRVGQGAAACTTNPNTGPSCILTHPTYQVGSPAPSGAGNGQVCMTLRDMSGANWLSTRFEAPSAADLSGVYAVTPAPACLPGTQRGFGSPCTIYYNPGGNRGTVTFNIPAGGSGVLSFDQLTFKIYIPNPGGGGNAYEMWLDNIVLQPSTGAIGGIAAWRDCSVSSCPAV